MRYNTIILREGIIIIIIIYGEAAGLYYLMASTRKKFVTILIDLDPSTRLNRSLLLLRGDRRRRSPIADNNNLFVVYLLAFKLHTDHTPNRAVPLKSICINLLIRFTEIVSENIPSTRRRNVFLRFFFCFFVRSY